jgi:hypothetical protein
MVDAIFSSDAMAQLWISIVFVRVAPDIRPAGYPAG